MDSRKLEELVLSLQNEITTLKAWADSEIAKRDKIIIVNAERKFTFIVTLQ